jgi:hypothetical protein
MSEPAENPMPVTGKVATALVFFALVYVYLWRVVEPHLLFHGAGAITDFPAFYTGWGFLREHLSYPGGPALYLSAFLSQSFYHSWLGALVITLQALGTCLCSASLLQGAKLPCVWFIGYMPAMLLAVLYGQYTYPFPTTVALLIALACTCAYVSVTRHQTSLPARLMIFIGLSATGYFIAGGAYLLFVVLAALLESSPARNWRLVVLYAALGALLPYLVGVLVLAVALDDAYTQLLPISWRVLRYPERSRCLTVVCALYLLVPTAFLSGLIPRGRWAKPGGRTGPFATRIPSYSQSHTIRWLAQTLLLVGAGAGIAAGSLDRKEKTRFVVDYYAFHHRWPEVLAQGGRHADNRFVMHAVNRALYHTGRLGDEMFQWPQEPAYLFLIGTGRDWVHWPSFDVHLDLGLINLAEHSLTESLERLGDRPMILQRLALINLVKGNAGTARIYLRALGQTLFHRRWAAHYLTLLENDPNLSTDRTVQHLRAIALEQDFPWLDVSKERILLALLEKDPGNRMAFEYLMAWYLTNRQLARFTKQIERLREMGYARLPRHFEEAVLLYVYGTRQTLHLSGYQPRDQLQEQMGHVVEILERHRGNRQAALAELTESHRGTYVLYYLCASPDQEEP